MFRCMGSVMMLRWIRRWARAGLFRVEDLVYRCVLDFFHRREKD